MPQQPAEQNGCSTSLTEEFAAAADRVAGIDAREQLVRDLR
ncbi:MULTISPECIES: hypothetical protein [Cryobacterium]|jgi:hypothetical protein|nr:MULTISPECIES: hypothetical protein [Cryobacterium]